MGEHTDDKIDLSEDEQTRRGEMLAGMMQLRRLPDGRYNTAWGTKTPLGLYRTAYRIVMKGK